jgi:hypothetical protein
MECHHLCGNTECVNAAEHIIALSKADHAKLHAFARRQKTKKNEDDGN